MDTSTNLTPEQLTLLNSLLDSAKTGVPAPGQSTAAATPPGQAAAPPLQETPTTLEFDWGGQHYAARDQAELQRILDQAQASRQSEIDATAARQLAEQQRQQALQRSVTPPDPNAFSKERYAELFLDDPRKANNYADAHDPAKMRVFVEYGRAIEDLRSTVAASRDEQAALAFMSANPDWKQSEDNLAKLTASMQELGHDKWTTATMTSAFKYAKATGAISVDGSDAGAEGDQYDGQPQRRLVAPPRNPRRRNTSTPGGEDMIEQFSALTAAQQKDYLEKLNPA